jgi:hypothetical protein
MAAHIKYSKESKKKSFTDRYFNNKFSDVNNMTPAQQTGIFYKKANELRDGFKPIFSNETQYLPNVMGSQLVSDFSQTLDTKSNQFKTSFPNKKSLTIPPNKKADDVIKFIVIGGALFLVYQILTD